MDPRSPSKMYLLSIIMFSFIGITVLQRVQKLCDSIRRVKT